MGLPGELGIITGICEFIIHLHKAGTSRVHNAKI